jgi:predicted Zn-dependent protease
MTMQKENALVIKSLWGTVLCLAVALALPSALFIMPGCKTVAGANRLAADLVLPVSEENKLGEQMKKELSKELTLLNNADINSYVKALGKKVALKAAKDTPKGIKITFKVVDDDKTVNAFAIPGGTIYMYTGLLKAAENEAEVMAVLGHEVAHVTKRHVAQRLVAAYGLQAILDVTLGKNPGLLGQLVGGITGNGVLLKHSRDAERESDEVGFKYMVAADYNPQGYVTFFSKLAKASGPEFLAVLQTHPHPEERVKNARAAIKASGKLPSNLGKEKYQEMKAKL